MALQKLIGSSFFSFFFFFFFFFFYIRNEDFMYQKERDTTIREGTRCPIEKQDTRLLHETIDDMKDKTK